MKQMKDLDFKHVFHENLKDYTSSVTFEQVWDKYSNNNANANFLRKMSTRKIAVISMVSLTLTIGFVIAIGLTSPSIAQALKQIPIIGSVFEITGDDGLKRAHEKGMVSGVEQSVTDENITVKIVEAFNDGTRISVGYILESANEISTLNSPHLEFKIDGKRLRNYGAGGSGEFIDKYTYAGLLQIYPDQELPESFNFEMMIDQLGDKKGKWNFSFPVSKNVSSNKIVMPMLAKTYGDTTIILEKITFAVSSTEFVGQIKQPKDSGSIQFEIADDQGTKLGVLSESGHTEISRGIETTQWSALYSSVKKIPKSITIRPMKRNQVEVDPAFAKGLEMTILID